MYDLEEGLQPKVPKNQGKKNSARSPTAKRFYQNKAFPPTCVRGNANDKRFCKNR